MTSPILPYLNIGCGRRYHSAWTNIDMNYCDRSVALYDARDGLPYDDGVFAVVYHSHVLEHLQKPDAAALLVECWRVLRPGGTIRVAVPDLEVLARTYLESLQRATSGICGASDEYDWIMLEMYDQTVRERSGGDIIAYLSGERSNAEFAVSRWGTEAKAIIDRAQNAKEPPSDAAITPTERAKCAIASLWRLMASPLHVREFLVKILLGKEYAALQVGRFRLSGEVHQWMYDRYSLARLLSKAGFRDPKQVRADESRIPGWPCFRLDAEADGSVYKPDSLYMEAVK
jgi:predicted SAM-dependent methyltransferase